MTQAQIVADYAKRVECYRYDPVGFCREVLGFEPHVGQRKWLGYSNDVRRNALVTGNRWGKSHIAAAKIIWKCAFRKGWTTALESKMQRLHQPYHAINISITAQQARLVWMKAEAMLQSPTARWLLRDIKRSPFPIFEFINGSVFEARSTGNNGERLLGDAWDHCNYDEAAYEKRFKEIRDNILVMRLLDRRGSLDFTSTGNGRNDFGEYFLTGLPGSKKNPALYSQTGPTWENAENIDGGREAIDLEAAAFSERHRRQNVFGEIVDGGGGFFDPTDLQVSIDDELTRQMLVHDTDDQEMVSHAEIYAGRDIEAESNGTPWHSKYHSHSYVHFWDLADKRDFVVGYTLDTSGDQMVVVEFERFNKRGWSYNFDRIRERHHKYAIGYVDSTSHGLSRTIVDSTGVGDVAVEQLEDISAEGFKFTKQSKDEILSGLQSAFSLRKIRQPMIPVSYDEHKFYQRDDDNLRQDCVMSLAGAVHFGKRREFVFEGY